MRRYIAISLLCFPAALAAQQAEHTISPGMSRAEVVAALGSPATVRTASEYTYMFYPNSCGRACGMNDLVILRHDSVSDAIFRSPSRHYTGVSSSPAQVTPEVAPHRARPEKPMTIRKADTTAAKPAAAKTTKPSQMKPPAKANDTKPSIPVKPPQIPAAPPQSTAPTKKPG